MSELKFVNYKDLESLKRKRKPKVEAPKRDIKRRSRKGCFTCRKRKKKCDEVFPLCNGCKNNYLECLWPEARESENVAIKPIEGVTYIVTVSTDPEKSTVNPIVSDSPIERPDEYGLVYDFVSPGSLLDEYEVLSDDEDTRSNPLIDGSSVESQLVEYRNVKLSPITPPMFDLTPFSTWIPGVTLSSESAMLYHIYVNNYMLAVSPQLTHPNLTVQAVFVPPGEKSHILREVFYCCAATYLGWSIPEYNEIAQRKYMKLIRMIKKESILGNISGSEDWLLVAVLCLCLRERHFGECGTKSAQHIVAAFRILEARRRKRELNGTQDEITPTERTLSDSFLYNYSMSILFCNDTVFGQLPDPFLVFDQFRQVTATPVYDTPISWMNSSILGSGTICFELVAKSSWLSRLPLPLTPYWRNITEDLYLMADFYQPTMIPEEIKTTMSPKNYDSLRFSTLISCNKAKSAQIMLRKILFPTVDSDDSEIQKCVEIVYKNFKEIPTGHFTNGISSWSLLVAGACAITDEHRELFKAKCFALGQLVHGKFYICILDSYERAWGNENYAGIGCDILLDRECLEQITA